MKELGRLKKISLREIWKREPEFSAWLANDTNLSLLSEKIGIGILSEELEAGVGDFSADILAKEDGGERLVIIENQFGNTDHDHLGKLITYASGRNAKVLIWITEHARDEHRAAVQWLNENTDKDIGVFLVKIEVLTIGDSQPAPQFTVLEAPNDWVKSTRQATVPITDTKKQQAVWWNSFLDYAMKKDAFKKLFNRVKANPQHWLNLAIGSSHYHISLTATTQNKLGAEIYITDNKHLYEYFHEHKNDIEAELGFEMDWQLLPDRRASRIEVTTNGDFTNLEAAQGHFEWYCEKAIAFKKVFSKYAREALKS